MRRGIIDRFEDRFVLIEIGDKIEAFPRSSLSYRGKEGDAVIILTNEIRYDQPTTEKRQKQIKTLMDDLWED